MKNLKIKFVVRNGKGSKFYFYILPDNLAKREMREEAILFCEKNNLEYAIINGTPRAIEKHFIKYFQRICTSYINAGGMRWSFGRQQANKTGGINYKHLINEILADNPRAITFAKICKNQNYENIKTTNR